MVLTPCLNDLHSLCIARLTGREKRVGGFDLMWNDGPVYMDDASGADCIPNPSYPTNTFFGRSLYQYHS